jgi:hypothetical protein
MENEYKKAGLASIARGSVIENVDYELEKLVASCLDPNVVAKAKRKLVLTITVEPNHDRSQAQLSWSTKVILPPDAPGIEQLYISNNGDAFVHTPEQLTFEMFEQESVETVAKTLSLKAGGKQ